jgi:putative membrane protein
LDLAFRLVYRSEAAVLLALVCVTFAALGASPETTRLVWLLENSPVIVGVGFLILIHGRFRMTRLANRLVAIHALIIMVGGHYSYPEVPIGDWARATFDLSRNHYDRVAHFAQGFFPAIIAREVLLRTTALRSPRWLYFIVVSICLAGSAAYEIMEWLAALAIGMGHEVDAFLAIQGDPWDTQWDMALALLGAIIAQLLFFRAHDRHLAEVQESPNPLRG